jgi:hypothetical protein
MKSILIIVCSTLFLFATVFMVGCKNDPCKGVTCAYSGTCVEGGCKCQVGYEGVHCETIMRDKFVGIWNVNENGTLSDFDQYPTYIEANSGLKVNEVWLRNVQNKLTLPVLGTVKGDSITIPKQVIQGTTLEGFGHITGTNALNQHYYQHATMKLWYYTIDANGLRNEYGYPEDGKDGELSIWAK